VRDELTPTNFSMEDARLLLRRLRNIYSSQCHSGHHLRQDLREVLRPAYRNLLELLASRERPDDEPNTLKDEPLLATDGAGNYHFSKPETVFYADRRDTRDRIQSDQPIWTFVIEAFPAARSSLTHHFGVRVLEECIAWYPRPGELVLENSALETFRSELNELAPYVLARIAADRSDEHLTRTDARRLRHLLERLEPVADLELGCELEGHKVNFAHFERDAFVRCDTNGEPRQAFIVWGENSWPPDTREAEALASALCDVFGSGYFEPFLALVQAKTSDMRERILRRAGAPVDIEEQRKLFLTVDSDRDVTTQPTKPEGDIKTVLATTPVEQPAVFPDGDHRPQHFQSVPLYWPDELLVEGEPILVCGPNSEPGKKEREKQ